MDKVTQRQKIVNYLKLNGSATIRQLFVDLGINSPSKRLSELRSLGAITEIQREDINRDGEKVRYKEYYLKGEWA